MGDGWWCDLRVNKIKTIQFQYCIARSIASWTCMWLWVDGICCAALQCTRVDTNEISRGNKPGYVLDNTHAMCNNWSWLVVRPSYLYEGSRERFGWTLWGGYSPSRISTILYLCSWGVWQLSWRQIFDNEILCNVVSNCESWWEIIMSKFCHYFQGYRSR